MAAGIVVGLVGPVIELGKCIVAPVKRQLVYLCCFNSNVQRLNEEANKLKDERAGLQMIVDEARNNARVIDPRVVTWFNEVDEIQQKKGELDTEINKIGGGGCFSFKTRYSASMGAFKTAAVMKKTREDGRKLTVISHPPPPPSTVPLPEILERPTHEFDSRNEMEQDIMVVLKDEQVKVLGLCGMGGVGKTTLAQKIKNRVMMEDVFAESVMVVVSQHADMERIQSDIAGQLGLKFEETSLSSRAQRLCTRLTVDGKRRLIVLDDVWEPLKLEDLGIPCNRSECTILLTSRVKSVFTRMDIDEANVLVVQTLTEEEAWSLFKEKVGACAEEFSSLAQDIANECKGLPLALTTLAGALKQEKNIYVWEDALKQLRHSNPEDLTDVLEGVYSPLKLSYDYLSSSNAKSIFLLCSLFPEDSFIHLEDLSACAMGLHLFRGLETSEEVRGRTVSVINNLKSRFLLLDDYYEDLFRMHDVIRDVAIHIASNEVQLTNCGYNSTWISPFIGGGERIELSNGSTFPNLRLLLIDGNQMQISDDIFLKGKEQLNVLSITSNSSITSLQLTTKNLKTLILKQCDL